MFWIFLGSSLSSVAWFLYLMSKPHSFPLLWSVLVGPVFCVYSAAIAGAAAWTIWKRDAGARGWAIVACFMYILTFLRQFIIPVRAGWWDQHYLVELFAGLVGLVSFAWPDKQVDSSHPQRVRYGRNCPICGKPVELKLITYGAPFRCQSCDAMLDIYSFYAWLTHALAATLPFMVLRKLIHLDFWSAAFGALILSLPPEGLLSSIAKPIVPLEPSDAVG
jgi:endogenous inhibitor of DNA gyrase (YacG/DUF329 family)